MQILVINCGSSSIKLDQIDPETGHRAATALVERIGTPGCQIQLGDQTITLPDADHGGALSALLPHLDLTHVGAVGHRVVHGGQRFTQPTLITDAVEAGVEALFDLAPLHNPGNLQGVRAARRALPDLPHVAVFDTAFHATLPPRAYTYAIPGELGEKHGLRRYGFHGPSHGWVAARAADYLNEDIRDLRIITCHLGNGSSITAVEYGRSVETSMGMTPLEGLVMGTRCGDLDPGLLLTLQRREGWTVDQIDTVLNRKSGLAGLSGVSNDLRDIEARASEGDERCRLALHVFAHRLRKYIGGYAAVMGGVDAIVFTGGIGENSALMRHRALQRFEFLGARLDEDANRDARPDDETPVVALDGGRGRVRLLAVRTDEGRAIAQATAKLVAHEPVDRDLTLPIAVSARHIHLTQDAIDTLFGKGHQLTPYKPLSQPGQYACEEQLTIQGPKHNIEHVRVLGPVRSKCQVEISRTDEFYLGVDAPVRGSGDVANSPGVTLIGPAGTLTLTEGLICAWRHIHMTPADAERFGVKHRDVVDVAVDTDGRDLVFGDVLVRVSPKYTLEMHIDTDEANAAELSRDSVATLAATGRVARLSRKRH
jgi:acetate kinase